MINCATEMNDVGELASEEEIAVLDAVMERLAYKGQACEQRGQVQRAREIELMVFNLFEVIEECRTQSEVPA